MTTLLNFDDSLFHFINNGLQNPFFDALLPLLRNKYLWFPFYMFLLSFLILNFDKKGVLIIVGLAVAVALADFTSSQLIKKTVQRQRPCKVLEHPKEMNLLVPCGSGFSFPSSHAANHFAIAVFLSLVFAKRFRWVKWPLLFWAAFICLAQVYVGVHYPLDVAAGAVWGTIIATAIYFLIKKLDAKQLILKAL